MGDYFFVRPIAGKFIADFPKSGVGDFQPVTLYSKRNGDPYCHKSSGVIGETYPLLPYVEGVFFGEDPSEEEENVLVFLLHGEQHVLQTHDVGRVGIYVDDCSPCSEAWEIIQATWPELCGEGWKLFPLPEELKER